MKFIAVILLCILSYPLVGVVYAAESSDPAREIKETVTEWGKQQLVGTVKSIFKTNQDSKSEEQRVTFGTTIIQVGLLMFFGWIISFIMPDKISSLMRIQTFLGAIQYLSDFISSGLQNVTIDE